MFQRLNNSNKYIKHRCRYEKNFDKCCCVKCRYWGRSLDYYNNYYLILYIYTCIIVYHLLRRLMDIWKKNKIYQKGNFILFFPPSAPKGICGHIPKYYENGLTKYWFLFTCSTTVASAGQPVLVFRPSHLELTVASIAGCAIPVGDLKSCFVSLGLGHLTQKVIPWW